MAAYNIANQNDGVKQDTNNIEPVGQEKSAAVAIITALAAVASIAGNIYSNHKINQSNKELAERQNQMNIEQWLRETGYNTPHAQMQRLLSAGLNPSLMYQGGNFTNSAASSPHLNSSIAPMKPIELDPTSMAQTISSIHQNRLMDAQARQADAQAVLTESQAKEYEASAGFKEAQANTERTLLPERHKAAQKNLDMIDAQIQYYLSQRSNIDQQTFNLRLKSMNIYDLDRATIHNLQSQWKLNEQELNEKVNTFTERLNYLKIHNQLERSQIRVNNANVGLIKAQTETEKERKTLVYWQGQEMYWKSEQAQFQFHLSEKYDDAEKFLGLCQSVAGLAMTKANIINTQENTNFLHAKSKYYNHRVWQNWIDLGLKWRGQNQQFILGMGKLSTGFMSKKPAGGWNGIAH